MAWALTEQETRFQGEVRDFLARELTPELRQAGRRCSGIFCDYARIRSGDDYWCQGYSEPQAGSDPA